jgi:spore germination protein KC
MKKILVFIFIISYIFLGSGCWSKREIETLAIVGAYAVDKVTIEGQEKYRSTALVLKPFASQQSMQGSASNGEQYWIFSAIGDNVFDSARNLSARSPRFVFSAHSDLIIIGERLAREDGIDKVIDLVLRHKDFRLRNYILISKGEALKILEASPELESTLSQEIVNIIENSSENISKSYTINIQKFTNILMSSGQDAVTGKIETVTLTKFGTQKQPDKSVRLTGTAVFKGFKMVGWLGDIETKGFLYLINKAKFGVIPINTPGNTTKNLSFSMKDARTEILPLINEDEISFTVNVKAEGNIGDVEDKIAIAEPEQITKIEKIVNNTITDIIYSAVQKSQELEADIFGFGETIHHKNPKVWKEISPDWKNIYPYLTVNVNVETTIHGTGMIADPIDIN